MRLESRPAEAREAPWMVWHVEQCRTVSAVWVDDLKAQWAEQARPVHIEAGRPRLVIFQARRIVISTKLRLVLINPVGDDEHEKTKRLEYARWPKV